MRHLDWQNRLTAYIDEVRYAPFVFEDFNCLFYVFGGIKAVNELDLYPLYEGRATDEKAGALALRKVDNVETVEECLKKHLGGEFQPVGFARPGDIVFIEEVNDYFDTRDMRLFGPIPGICYGINSFFLDEDGLIQVPTLKTDKTLWVS